MSSTPTSSMENPKEPKPRRVDFVVEKSELEIKTNLLLFWQSIPLFVKLISIVTFIFYIISLFFPFLSFYLANIPFYTLNKFQFWRLLTSALITTNIFNIIIGLIFWVREASSLESSLGTIKYGFIFFRNSFFIQFLYTVFVLLLRIFTSNKNVLLYKIISDNPERKVTKNCGFWPVIMCEMTLLCLSNSDTPVKFLFLPCPFKAKFYPIIWMVIFSAVNFNRLGNICEVLVGVIFAFIYHFMLKNILTISDSCIEKVEGFCGCACLKKIYSFVSVGSYINNKYEKAVTGEKSKSYKNKKNNKSDIQVLDRVKLEDGNKSRDNILERTINVNIRDEGSFVSDRMDSSSIKVETI